MAEVRKKIKWQTKARNGRSRRWKSKWVTVWKDEKGDKK